jgi:ribonuclease HI
MAKEYANTGLTLPAKYTPAPQQVLPVSWQSYDYCCYIDGPFSMADGGQGGAVAILKQGEHLISYSVEYFQALSPLHSEVQAISLAVREIQLMELDRDLIISDCKQLVDVITSKESPLHLDWRVYIQSVQLWMFLKTHCEITCVFMVRENNREAHHLSNWARIRRESVRDCTYPLMY